MGIKHFSTYLNEKGAVEACPPKEKRSSSYWSPVFAPHHLVFDMNALLHSGFEKQSKNTPQSWINGCKKKLQNVIETITPTKSISFFFDGVAPLGKLEVQRDRRKSVLESHVELEGYEAWDVPFERALIISGCPIFFLCENELKEWVFSFVEKSTSSDIQIIWSGSLEPGEGEIKISDFFNRCKEEVRAESDDSFTIIGNDSDLALISIMKTEFTKIFVVDPEDLKVSIVRRLIEHWRDTVPNPPLHLEVLNTYCLDYVFIMLLSGCDYFSGVGPFATRIWKTYRNLRGDGGFFKQRLIETPNCSVNIHFLRAILNKVNKMPGKCSPSGSPDPSLGKEILLGAMWAFRSMYTGKCVNPCFISQCQNSTRKFVHIDSLIKAVNKKNIEKEMCDVMRTSSWINLDDNKVSNTYFTPFEQYIAVLGTRGQYSAEVKAAINKFDETGALKSSSSIRAVAAAVKNVVHHINFDLVLPVEKELMLI